MARKHEHFSYWYGMKCAPEQWHFYWNQHPIRLVSEDRSTVAGLMIAGREKEAEDVLKRLLRKQEKEATYVCIGFWAENSRQFYYTKDLKCRDDSLMDKLLAYKKFKSYVQSNGGVLSTHTIRSGFVVPEESEAVVMESYEERINLNQPCKVRLYKPVEERVFLM